MAQNDRVIGGEFSISHEMLVGADKTCVTFSCGNNNYYSSGRCALYAILNDIEQLFGKQGGILLPDYLCESITQTVIDKEWLYNFYHIGSDLHIDMETTEKELLHAKAILLIEYFGVTNLVEDIARIKLLAPDLIIIVDCVQAFYSMNKYQADYIFTSFRKWFACPDGAMVKKNIPGDVRELKIKKSLWADYKYAGNILKQYSRYVDENIALELLEKGEKLLDKEYLSSWSEVSKDVFLHLDFDHISAQRKNNAKVLHDELDILGIEHIYSETDTPLFVPIFVEKRDELRRWFFLHDFFTPKHWPKVSDELNGVNELYDRELSLICDQRYSAQDMVNQIEIFKKYLKDRK